MDNLKELKVNICVITHQFNNIAGEVAGEALLTNFIKLLEPLSNEIFIIPGNIPEMPNKKIHIIRLKGSNEKDSILKKVPKFILTQLKISYNLAKISKNIDIVIFYIGARLYVLTVLFAKLLRKKVVVIAAGSSSKIAKSETKGLFGSGRIVFPCVFEILEKINYNLSDQIIIDINVESESLIHQFGLAKYRNKISFGGAGPVNVNSFRITKKSKDRKDIIGYIGRHSPEKGVMNFVKAIPLILKERNDLEFIIGSDGPLFEQIKDELKKNGSYDKVTFTGWVPREKLPDYFNEMKLIVVPSYTETIPTVIMEALACGTPIVASPVDAIPDLIRDGENGFLMEDNSPECIAKNVIRALDDPRLDEIVKSAYELIQREYTYEVVVENYRKLLMGKDKRG